MHTSFRLCLLIQLILWLGIPAYGQQPHTPKANPEAIVTEGDARFTVLTDRLIRMEWDEDRDFEDRATLVFINRDLEVPDYEVTRNENRVVITTDSLELEYTPNGGKFDSTNLEIEFQVSGGSRIWHPGMENEGNLKGTTRTLDVVKGATELDDGILSRDGWALVNDTNRPLFDDSDWPWAVERADSNQQDWYFFGYGHDYKGALQDYTNVAGKIPMPPRFAFGLWWSRYWAYTDQGLKDLVRQYENHNTPLDVLVIDMDWHETFELRWDDGEEDQAGEWKGWTGYTWNETYFPDPEAFLDWTEEQGLKVPLNLHPASGIQPWETQYEEMARAMGIDPETREYVPFDIVDKEFTRNYFDIVIHPLEEQGVDFWWLDWQQWGKTEIEGVTPTWWLNYVFFTDMQRNGEDRPILFHRWGGLGNHRYQIGFSGDHYTSWKSLDFQPYFTATASNVGYGYWSHDIGGHNPGPVSGELYTRWMQFGIFSPIVRTHTAKHPDGERRFWGFDYKYSRAMREAAHLRYRMAPYIYSMARVTYDTGVSILRPLYYEHPGVDRAYEFGNEYYFGEDLLVKPVTDSLSDESLLAEEDVWLPDGGEWIEWFTGRRIDGGQVVERTFSLDEIPVYARPGTIIPMQDSRLRMNGKPLDPLVLTVFPGGSDSTRVYEDDGNGLAYKKGEYTWTPIRHQRTGPRSLRLEVLPTEGEFPGMQKRRNHVIRLPHSWPPSSVTYNETQTLTHADSDTTVGWHYDGTSFTTVIRLPASSVRDTATVEVTFPASMDDDRLDGMRGYTSRLEQGMDLLNSLWKDGWTPEEMIDLYQVGRRIELAPSTAEEELSMFHNQLPSVLRELPEVEGERSTVQRAINHLHALYSQSNVEPPQVVKSEDD